MSTKKSSPLLEVAMNYVDELNLDLTNEALRNIRSLFDNYINEKITYEKISLDLKKYIPNLRPLNKIYSILNIDYLPSSRPFYHQYNPIVVQNGKNEISSNTKKIRNKTRGWSIEEDQRLLMGVHLFGTDNWTEVSDFVGFQRTRSMCSQRWIRVLNPRLSKKPWTKDEDEKLLHLVEIYGLQSWMKISLNFGNRSDVQCRYHHIQLLKEMKKSESTSPKSSDSNISLETPILLTHSTEKSNQTDEETKIRSNEIENKNIKNNSKNTIIEYKNSDFDKNLTNSEKNEITVTKEENEKSNLGEFTSFNDLFFPNNENTYEIFEFQQENEKNITDKSKNNALYESDDFFYYF